MAGVHFFLIVFRMRIKERGFANLPGIADIHDHKSPRVMRQIKFVSNHNSVVFDGPLRSAKGSGNGWIF
jgi:hypothetical protein